MDMFVALREIPPDIAKVKYFHFDVMDRRTLDRTNIGGRSISDTTEVSSSSTTEATLKSYSFSVGANTNSIRIKVYGKSPDTVNATTYNIYIDGTLVASQTVTGVTDISIIIDYIGNLSPGSHIVEIKGYNVGGATFYVSRVYIVAGLKINTTTPTMLVNLTGLDTEYSLHVNGNFEYELGVRYWIKGNRKTTASATVTSNLASEITGVYNNLGAGDDDGEIWLIIRTGDFRSDPTISANVGTTGDVIIITGVYVQVVLRGVWPRPLVVKERGLVAVSGRFASVDTTSINLTYRAPTRNGIIVLWASESGGDITVVTPLISSHYSELFVYVLHSQDDPGRGIYLYVSVVVITA